MFDKFLCKWIHKNEITIGDIFETIFPALAWGGLVIVIIARFNYVFSVYLGIPYLKSVFFYLIVTFIAAVVAFLIFSIAVPGFFNMLQKINSVKIATCPNVKPESSEKSQDQ